MLNVPKEKKKKKQEKRTFRQKKKKKTLNQQLEALVCDASSYHSWVFWPYDLIYTALASSVKPVPVFHSSQYSHGIQMRLINKMVR